MLFMARHRQKAYSYLVLLIFIGNLLITSLLPVSIVHAQEVSPNALQCGTMTSNYGFARKAIDTITADDYYVSFNYMYPADQIMKGFRVWSSYDEQKVKYIGTSIIQEHNQLFAQTSDGSYKPLNIKVNPDVWYHILIHFRTDNTFEIFIDEQKALIGDSDIQEIVDTKVMNAIGFLGDVSSADHNGCGFFDNIKIYTEHEILFEEDFNTSQIEEWTLAQSELANPPKDCPAASLAEVMLLTDTPALLSGNTSVLKVRGILADGTPSNLTHADISYQSSNHDVIQIEQYSGNIATIKAVGSGTATITAVVLLNGVEKQASIELKVTEQPELYKIVLKAETTQIYPGDRTLINIKGFMSGGSIIDLMGSEVNILSDSPDVLGIEIENELVYAVGLKGGSARIIAERSGCSATLQMNIVELESISVHATKSFLVLNQDEYAGLTLSGNRSDGSIINLNIEEASVKSNNEQVITIETLEHQVRAIPKGTGEADVTVELAVYGGKTYNAVTSFKVSDSLYTKELVNGGFEKLINHKPAYWAPFTVENIESSTHMVYEGQYSVKLTDPSAQEVHGLRSLPILVTPGEEYVGSIYSYNESGVSELYVEFWDEENNRINVTIGANSILRTWRKIEVFGEAPQGAAYATLLLVQHRANEGVAYFDQAEFGLFSEQPAEDFPLKVEGHPRLYFTEAEIDSLKVKASDDTMTAIGKSYKDIWNRIETLANDYLNEDSFTVTYYGGYNVTYPLPPKQPAPMPPPPGFTSGDYPYWTMMSRGIQERLETLSLAYIITGEAGFGQRAKEYVMSLIEWEQWTERPSVVQTNLDTTHLTLGVSTAYDMLYDLFTDDEKIRVEEALEEKGLKHLYKDVRTKVDHNIQMLRAVALGAGSCVLLEKSENANQYLTRAIDYYEWYLDERMMSGQQEGLMYTSYALDNLMKAVDQIARVTGELDLINHPFLNDFIVQWVTYFLAPGQKGLANFSDSSPTNYYFLTMNVLSNWLNNGYAGWYISEAKPNASGLEEFLYYNATANITSPDDLADSIVLDEIGWAALRSGWESKDTLLAFIANNSSMGHNHFDQNSFQIATNGVWIATDAGYQDYSAGPRRDFTLKRGHNTIWVDGQPQSSRGGGQLIQKSLSPMNDYVVGSADGAYQNPNLNKFDRHIVQVKHKEPYYYVMLDNLKADQPRNFDWILYTGGWDQFLINQENIELGAPVRGDELQIQKGPAQMSVKFLSEEQLTILAEQYPGAEDYGPYIKVSSPSQAEEYSFMNVITTGSAVEGIFIEAADLIPPIESSGKEYKLVNVGGRTAVFYRGNGEGDFITFEFDVPEDGLYDVGIHFIKSFVYGMVNVYFDGVLLDEVYDGYDEEVKVAPMYAVGEKYLIRGKHTLKLEVVGKNENSTNYFMGINAIQLTPNDQQEDKTFSVDARLMKDENVIGAEVVRSDTVDGYDMVLFKKEGAASYTINEIESDAEQLTVSSVNKDDTISCAEAFSMVSGTTFAFQGKTLFVSNEKSNASIQYHSAENVKGTIATEQATRIGIYTGFNPEVIVNDLPYDNDKLTFDSETGITYIDLEKGDHVLNLKAKEWGLAEDVVIDGTANIQGANIGNSLAGQYQDGMYVLGIANEKRRLEGFQLQFDEAPSDMMIVYRVYVQSDVIRPNTKEDDMDTMWQDQEGVFWKKEGLYLGQPGEKRRIEGVEFKLIDKRTGKEYEGYKIQYQVHVYEYGWGIDDENNDLKDDININASFEEWAEDGDFAGTKEKSQRLEAVRIRILKEQTVR